MKETMVDTKATYTLAYRPFLSKWSLSNLVALLQFQIFTHRDLWAWLNEPFTGPPSIEVSEQLVLTAVA